MKHSWVLGILTVMTALQVGCRSNPTASPDYGHWGALEQQGYDLHQALVYALQDEQLAEAEYQYVNGTFGNPAPFTCIVNVEAIHVSELAGLLTQRGWPVPANTASEYVVTVGSLGQAYQAGVDAEAANIAMHDRFLSRSDLPADVRSVLETLRNASVCHRNAFQRRSAR